MAATRHLAPIDVRDLPVNPCPLVLCENDGTDVVVYRAVRSFRRIQRDGRWFRIAGVDRATGELVYLPEPED